jgi:dTDP-4-dehydrorhamnose reductase
VTAEPLRWLVLGAQGRLGRRLCTPSRPWLIPLDRKAVDAVDADAIMLALRHTDAFGVLNLAAAADVARCEREPEWAYLGNVLTARGAAQGACRAGKAIVHVSTDYVFGEPDPDLGPNKRPPWGPNNPAVPVNVYGRSKLAGEDAVREILQGWSNPRGGIARMSFLADPPGYAWVIGGVRVTKEWIDTAAVRLARFLLDPGLVIPGLRTVHLVPNRDTTLDVLVHERYPEIPVIPYEEGRKRLPYALPADLRLGGAWRG